MPRPTMDVNGEEYQEILRQRELYKIYKSDYPLMKRVLEVIERLEKKNMHEYTLDDEDDLAAARAAVDWVIKKYNPDQPRVPAGNTGGGRWTSGGGGGMSNVMLPRPRPVGLGQNPARPRMTQTELDYFNRNAPEGLPAEQLEIAPGYDYPRWYVEGAVKPTISPLDFIGVPGKPLAGLVGTEAIEAYNTYRLRGYLSEARQIPKDVYEVIGRPKSLTESQSRALKSFLRKRSKYKEGVEVVHYSDGRVIFTVKQPAANIPNSYAVWEEQVDMSGKTIRMNKTVVGPEGELVHIKNYKK